MDGWMMDEKNKFGGLSKICWAVLYRNGDRYSLSRGDDSKEVRYKINLSSSPL